MGDVAYTTVVVVDRRTLGQFAQVWPTWQRHRPELLAHPLLVLADSGLAPELVKSVDHPDATIAAWLQPTDWPQRERALTTFVHRAPFLVHTPYWLKIDTDSVAVPCDRPWPEEQWFRREPAIVARPWGYTKPGTWLDTLQDWAAGHPTLGQLPQPDWPRHDAACQVYRRPRIISYQAFLRTDWTREMSALCPGRLPVPSQDTYHWFLAAMLGEDIQKVRWPHFVNRNTRRGLEEAVRGSLS